MQTVELRSGTYVYRPADASVRVYEFVSGVVKVGAYSEAGAEWVCDVLRPGEVFGNLQPLAHRPNGFARCLTPVVLRSYPLTVFQHAITHCPTMVAWFHAQAFTRWSRMERRLLGICTEPILTRLINLQVELGQPLRDARGRVVNPFDLLTQQDIADLIGATRQTVAALQSPCKPVRVKPTVGHSDGRKR